MIVVRLVAVRYIHLLGVLTFCFDYVTHSMKDLKPVRVYLNEQSAVAMFV